VTRALATLSGVYPRLCRALDARLAAEAVDAGAREVQYPTVIGRAVLDRTGYFEAFPHGATALDPAVSLPKGGAWVLQPAVCYQCYAQLEGARIDRTVLTAAGRCYRHGESSFDGLTRLWEFTMREIVLLGPAEWVRAEREAWLEGAARVVRALGIEARLAPATDPFFGAVGRGRELIQRLKSLKHELQADAGEAGEIAVASVNLHESFFGSRFGITLNGGTVAHSACVAFGIERLAAALVAQRGEKAAAELTAEV
jgi:seryl-tRNA synthetase